MMTLCTMLTPLSSSPHWPECLCLSLPHMQPRAASELGQPLTSESGHPGCPGPVSPVSADIIVSSRHSAAMSSSYLPGMCLSDVNAS